MICNSWFENNGRIILSYILLLKFAFLPINHTHMYIPIFLNQKSKKYKKTTWPYLMSVSEVFCKISGRFGFLLQSSNFFQPQILLSSSKNFQYHSKLFKFPTFPHLQKEHVGFSNSSHSDPNNFL